MFKIVDFQQENGTIRCAIEADDQFFGMFVRFIQMAQSFCILLDYKIAKEREIDDYAKTQPERLARAGGTRAELLQLFRNMPGSRTQRLKILKEMLHEDGMDFTQDRISAEIRLARQEEKDHHMIRVKRLIQKGIPVSDIASTLGIPRTSAARYAREIRGARKRHARMKRSVLSLAKRPPEPSSAQNPASILPGAQKTRGRPLCAPPFAPPKGQ